MSNYESNCIGLIMNYGDLASIIVCLANTVQDDLLAGNLYW